MLFNEGCDCEMFVETTGPNSTLKPTKYLAVSRRTTKASASVQESRNLIQLHELKGSNSKLIFCKNSSMFVPNYHGLAAISLTSAIFVA